MKIQDYLPVSDYKDAVNAGAIIKRHTNALLGSARDTEKQNIKTLKKKIKVENSNLHRIKSKYKTAWHKKDEPLKAKLINLTKQRTVFLRQYHKQLFLTKHKIAVTRRKIILQELGQIRTFGNNNIQGELYHAAQYLPTAWTRQVGHIKVISAERGYLKDNIMACPSDLGVILHLLVHAVEKKMPILTKIEKEFWLSRKQGHLSWIGYPFRREEIGVKEKFRNRFLCSSQIEILATSIPTIFGFYDQLKEYLILKDPEVPDFIYGLLAGV
jgi:hypothetical protein